MKILAIETSCDETAVCILEASGAVDAPDFKILGNALYSQIAIHKEYGGVFPALAKREHSKNLIPILRKALEEAKELIQDSRFTIQEWEHRTSNLELRTLLVREPELLEQFFAFIPTIKKPDIDAIAVTVGPGLEPALWVGINFAKALSLVWGIPMYPINHLEGHILSPFIETHEIKKLSFPALALIISGGHTELVHMKNLLNYEIIGRTKDDAVGEAFDKVARMLDLPYPGGPEISKIAEEARTSRGINAEKSNNQNMPAVKFPRPMIKSLDFDFSFSGLKTSVLYFIKKQEKLTPELKASIAKEFEDSVIDVLVAKTKKALIEYQSKSLILGGGVIANTRIRKAFEKLVQEFSDVQLHLSPPQLATDNAVMIGVAGYFNVLHKKNPQTTFTAQGNLNL